MYPDQQQSSGGGNFITNLLSGFVKPITTAVNTELESQNLLNARRGGQEFTPQFLNQQKVQQLQQNAFMPILQSSAGLASYAVPAGGVFGGGLRGAILSGAGQGALSGFGETGDLGGTLQGALLGGATGGAFQKAGDLLGDILGKGGQKIAQEGVESAQPGFLSKFTGGKKLKDVFDEGAEQLELSAMRQKVGSNASTALGKGGMAGADLEKFTFNAAKEFGQDIQGPESLVNLADNISQKYGGQADDMAMQLSQQGKLIDIENVISPLRKQLETTTSPRLQSPLNNAIEEITTMAGGKTRVTPTEALNIKRQLGDLMGSVGADDKSLGKAFRKAYGSADESLVNAFKGTNFDFKGTNQYLSAAIRMKEWANKAAIKDRGVPVWSHTLQQAAGGGGLAGLLGFGAGGPLGAMAAYGASRYAYSPLFKQHLAKGLRTAANLSDNVSAPQLLQNLLDNPQMANVLQNQLLQQGIQRGAIPGLVSSLLGTANTPGGSQTFQQTDQGTQVLPPQMGGSPMTQMGDMFGGGSQMDSMQQPLPQMNSQNLIAQLLASGQKPSDVKTIVELLGIGGGSTKPLSSEQQKQLSNIQTGLSALDTIEQLSSQGNLARGMLPGFLQSGESRMLDTAIAQATDVIGRLRSGGAINSDEEKRFRSFLPGVTDDPQTKQYKLQQLRNAFQLAMPQGGGQDQSSLMGALL